MNLSSLDLLLAEWLARALRCQVGAEVETKELAVGLRGALEDPPVPEPDDPGTPAGGGEEGAEELLAGWVRAALEAALEGAGLDPGRLRPQVVVLLAGGERSGEELLRALHTRAVALLIATRSRGELGDAEELPVLVLAEGEVRARLTELRETIWQRLPELEFVDLRRPAPPEPPAIAVLEVPRFPPGLRELADAMAMLGEAVDDLGRPEPATQPGFVDLSGKLLGGRYRLERCVGTGGFGAVYEAVDERFFGGRHAIKVLHPHVAADAMRLKEFQDEARRLMRLDHPNVVTWRVFDHTDQGTHYFVMELLRGGELQEVLEEEGTLPPARVARIVLQVLDALRAAHHLGPNESILHLDLKPKNVFLVPDDTAEGGERVKIIDFGVGQYIGAEELDAPVPAGAAPAAVAEVVESNWHDTMLTVRRAGRGSTAGTPAYASPEQAARMLEREDVAPLDGRSDLYSLGVMAYQMLAGRLPYEGSADPRATLRRHMQAAPDDLRKVAPQVPRNLARFVMRCLRKDPDERWRDAREAYQVMARVVRPRIGRATLAIALAAAATVLISVGWALQAGGRVEAAPLRDPASDQPVVLLHLDAREGAAARRLSAPGLRATGVTELRVFDLARGAPIEGVDATADEAGALLLSAAPFDGALESYPRARVERTDGEAATAEFALALLGPGACALDAPRFASVDVADARAESIAEEELRGRAVAVAGTQLLLGVADPAVVRAVRVARGDGLPVELRSLGRDAERAWYGLPLARVADEGLGVQRAELRPSVVDVTGAEREGRPIELELAGRIEPATCELRGVDRRGTLHYLTLRGRPTLAVSVDEPGCRLRWAIEWAQQGVDGPALRSDGWIALDPGEPRELALPVEGLSLPAPWAYASLRLYLDTSGRVWEPGASEEPGRELAPLQLYVTGVRPRFRLELLEGERALAATEGEVYPSSPALTLRLLRIGGAPMSVEARLLRELEGGALEEVWSRAVTEFQGFEGDEHRIELELPRDGRYRLEASARSFDVLEQVAVGDPLPGEGVVVVLDRVPPRLEASLLEGGEVRDRDPAHDGIRVAMVDAPYPGGAPSRTPATLRWRLERLAGEQREWRGGGGVPGSLAPGGARELSLAELLEAAPQLFERDGRYVLTFEGTDLAGNELGATGAAAVEWSVARETPSVELLTPAGSLWPRAGDGHEVRAEILDPNEVASVSLTVRAVDAPAELFMEDIALQRAAADSPTWSARIPSGPDGFDYRWSGRRVELELRAAPRVGAPAVLRAEVALPPNESAPPRIAWRSRAGARSSAPMRFVAGNAETYAFGGRDDATEDDALARAGLPPLSDGLGRPESWRVEYAPGELPAFYLDEREVSRGEFRAFVERGYDDAGLWPDGWSPRIARRAELLAELDPARGDDRLPVTGVSWGEAAAYARWAGKRLPSLVQLEFAARGGAEYRAYSCEGAAGSDALWCSRPAPAPVEQGLDRTPGTGLMNLGGNVAEWTATPFLAEAPQTRVREDARAHREEYLSPWGRADSAAERFVYGGDWRHEPRHFRRARTRPATSERAWSGDAVGFRCALLFEDVLVAVADPGASPFGPEEREAGE